MIPMDMNNPASKQIVEYWQKILTDSFKPPQSPEQIRREWYRTLKTEELWSIHDEITDELKSR